MDLTSVLKHSKQVTFQSVEGEAILIHIPSGKYFSLNQVGTKFWEMCDGSKSIEDHAQMLAQEYNVDKKITLADLLELSHKLLEKGLVEVV
jgi:hypothetical protein